MATVVPSSPLLDEKQTAELLNVTPGTLSVWRCTRRYPLPYIKVGRSVKYRLADIEAFISSRTVVAASESALPATA
jgi:predicted DNA-binding transcriptional regulator AlpA